MQRDKAGVRCRVCGCTDYEPCNPPCYWNEIDLCSECASAAAAINTWREAARRANMTALLREANLQWEEVFRVYSRRARGVRI